jgi:hypothetical protein
MSEAGAEATPSRAGPRLTLLELTARLMQRAFEELGEGSILGTMPAYLERFGRAHSTRLAAQGLPVQASFGAVSALAPMNQISTVTATAYTLPIAHRDRAVKRLHDCEFLAAFEGQDEFVRTMICMLHEATYQGSVNALVPKAEDGYDVTVRSRILFGDDHCDFDVRSRVPRPREPDTGGAQPDTPPEELEASQHHFYAYMVASFVDYLSALLPPARVAAIVQDVGEEVGRKLDLRPDDVMATLRRVMRAAGRTFTHDATTIRVQQCPQAPGILDATADQDEDLARAARASACGLCCATLQGAARQSDPDAQVVRERALTLGSKECLFRLVRGAS